MKYFIILVLCVGCLNAQSWDQYIKALHQVETSGRLGAIKGDNGRSLGGLQVSYAYWLDSGVEGKYYDVIDLTYAAKVVYFYALRYEPRALKNKDYSVLSKLHNGGPNWRNKKSTNKFWAKIKRELKK